MKQHRNLYRIEKFIVFLCIFTFPLHGIITNYMRHNPALWNHFFRSGYHIFFYDLMSFAMIFAFGSSWESYFIYAIVQEKVLI